MSLGEILQANRKEKGISLEEAARGIHISQKYLKALEDGAYDLIPGETYLYGFLRSYAAFLSLDPEEIGLLAREEITSHPHVTKRAAPLLRHREADAVSSGGGQRDVLLVFSIFILGAILWFFLVQFMGGREETTPMPPVIETESEREVAPKEPPFEEEPRAPESADTQGFSALQETQAGQENFMADTQSYSPIMLVLEAKVLQEVWVLVSLDGEEKEETLVPGRTRKWEAVDKIEITIGDAGNLTLRLNGQALPPLGKKGEVVSRTFTRE
ncbi:MAG: DUF4115 domain-containing protein [bacterium]|nr:DUF4115 domain-containing protein [bacterium]